MECKTWLNKVNMCETDTFVQMADHGACLTYSKITLFMALFLSQKVI